MMKSASERMLNRACRRAALISGGTEKDGNYLYFQPKHNGLSIVRNHISSFPFDKIPESESGRNQLRSGKGLDINKYLAWRLALMLLIENEFSRKQLLEGALICRNSPLIIIGLPGTGSTVLQTLLGLDPDARSILQYQTDCPTEDWGSFRHRIRESMELQDVKPGEQPSLKKVFASRECSVVLNNGLAMAGLQDVMNYTHPSYMPIATWAQTSDAFDRMFIHHRHFLQVINAQFGPRLPSHWVLKEPTYIHSIDHVLKEHPTAKFIWTHRNILDVAHTAAAKMGDALFTSHMLQAGAEDLGKVMNLRKTFNTSARFCDVYFDDLMRDPVETVKAIYTHYHMPLSEQHVTAMNGWLKMNFRVPKKYPHLKSTDFGYPTNEKLLWEYHLYLEQYPRAIPGDCKVERLPGDKIAVYKKK